MNVHAKRAGRPTSWPQPPGSSGQRKARQNLDVRLAPDPRGGWLVEWYDLDGNGTEDVRLMRFRQLHTATAYAWALSTGGGG
jgi:hypothetical protein